MKDACSMMEHLYDFSHGYMLASDVQAFHKTNYANRH